MNSQIDPEFASALRRALLEEAKPDRSPVRTHVRRTAFIGLGTFVGLGVVGAAAAAVFGLPGGEVEKSLSAPVRVQSTQSGSALLGEAPKGANAVHFEFECTSPGTYIIGSAGIVLTCDKADLNGTSLSGLASLDAVTDGALIVSANRGGNWALKAWYVDTNRTPLAKNKNGETYGVDSADAKPDLIVATATNGEVGYIRRSEHDAAVARVGSSTVVEIPVYENDGESVIGSFTVEGSGR